MESVFGTRLVPSGRDSKGYASPKSFDLALNFRNRDLAKRRFKENFLSDEGRLESIRASMSFEMQDIGSHGQIRSFRQS
jgi:hypothetical protein